jgi:hypothetical protein
MKEVVLEVPDEISYRNLERLFKKIDGCKDDPNSAEVFKFDLRESSYLSPSGAVALTAFRDHLIDNGVNTRAIIAKWGRRFYRISKVFGMFPSVDTTIDNAYKKRISNYAVGVERCISSEECEDAQAEIMEEVTDRVACKEGTEAALEYMIGEIWDNAGVHGYECYDSRQYPEPIYMGAFSYSSEVEVAILDRGQGIHSSLRSVQEYQNLSARQALKHSLKDEVSGHPQRSAGFGLYSAARFIAENGGSLSIWSSGRRLELDEYGNINLYGSALPPAIGTLIAFKIKAEVDIPYSEIVESAESAEEYLELVDFMRYD